MTFHTELTKYVEENYGSCAFTELETNKLTCLPVGVHIVITPTKYLVVKITSSISWFLTRTKNIQWLCEIITDESQQYIQVTNENGDKFWYYRQNLDKQSHKTNWDLHRDNDHPAIERANGTKIWFQYGKFKREEDKPTHEMFNGDKYWSKDELFHRERGPAVILSNGTRKWYRSGVLHRESSFEKN